MEKCEAKFRRIAIMTIDVWARVISATKGAISPIDHMRLLQEAAKREAVAAATHARPPEADQQANTTTRIYFELVSLLVYTLRFMVKYFTYMLRM